MKRKHTPGCYCCQCEEINSADLPTITIEGYTQDGNWSGSDCCKCLRFLPDDPQTICSISGVIATHQMTFTLDWQELAQSNPIPRVLVDEGIPAITSSYCCDSGVSAIADHSYEFIQKASYRIKSLVTPSSIDVCIYYLNVACDEEGPVYKWIILSRFNYSANVSVRADLYTKVTPGFTGSGNGCFSATPNCASSCEKTRLLNCEDDEPDVKCILSVGQIAFTRVKFYDELPSGSVTFNNDDTPENCSWDYCENPDEYYTSVCWEVTGQSDCVRNCLCYETLIEDPIQTFTFDNESNCCDCFIPPNVDGNFWIRYTSGACDTPVVTCDNNCQKFDCGTSAISRLRQLNLVVIPTNNGCLDSPGPNILAPYYRDLEWWDNSFYGSHYDMCIGITPRVATEYTCLQTNCGDLDNCNEDCCYAFGCDGDVVYCSEKYKHAGINTTGVSLTWECNTVQTQSFCLNAPSWTIVLE